MGISKCCIASLLILLNTCVTAEDLVLYPDTDVHLEPGSDLNLTCTCNSFNSCASEIVWQKQFVLIPTESYTEVNNITSQLSLRDLQFEDKGAYSCCMKYNQFECMANSIQVTIASPPGPVTNFHCTCRNLLDYWCEWEDGENTNVRNNYTFQYLKKGSLDVWINCPDTETKGDNSCNIVKTDTVPSGPQYLQLTTTNIMGTYVELFSFDLDTDTVPYPPTSVSVHKVDHESIDISWQTEDWNNPYYPAEDALQFKIRYYTYGSTQWIERLVPCHFSEPSSNHFLLDGLSAFTTYAVQVSARVCMSCINCLPVDEVDHWSTWSGNATTTTKEAAPTGSLDLHIQGDYKVSETKRDISLAWQELQEDQKNGIILGYALYVQRENVPNSVEDFSTSENTIVIKNLDWFSGYVVIAQAINSAGAGPNSTQTLIVDRTEEPTPPTDVETISTTNTSITLQWKPPSAPNGYMQNYSIEWKISERTEWLNSTTVPESTARYNIQKLRTYTLYDVRIRAKNHKYGGEWAQADSTRTLEGVPLMAPEPISLHNDPGDCAKLVVTWITLNETNANGVIQGYQVHYCASEQGYKCDGIIATKTETPGSSESTVLDKLQPYTQYLTWVAAYTNVGLGPSSTKVSATTSEGVPTVPLNLEKTSVNSSSIGLSWTAPVEPNGVIDHYTIQWEYQGVVSKVNVKGLHTVLAQLQGDTNYKFSVLACNAAHCSDLSTPVLVSTNIGAPGPPAVHDIEPRSSTKIYLSWESPLEPNGPILYYEVQHRRQSASADQWEWMHVIELDATVNVDCNIGEDDVMFEFRVTAVTIDEDGRDLRGKSSIVQKYEMCSPVPVYVAVPATVIPLSIIAVAILVACMVYRMRKLSVFKEVPEPFFKQDTRMDRMLHFYVCELEVFDEPVQCVFAESLPNSSNANLPIAVNMEGADDLMQHEPCKQWDTEILIKPEDGMAQYHCSDNTTDGISPDDENPYSKMSQIPVPTVFADENNVICSQPQPTSQISGLSHRRSDMINNIPVSTKIVSSISSRVNESSACSDPYSKMSQLPVPNSEPSLDIPCFSGPISDPYSKMSQLPVPLSEPSSNMQQLPVPNADPYSKMSQLPVTHSEPAASVPQLPVPNSDPYSKMSQLPVTHSEPAASIPQLPVPNADPNSKMSQLSVTHSEPAASMPQLPVPKYDPCSNIVHLPVPLSESTSNMPQLPIPNADPYSKMSQLPVTHSEPSSNMPQLPVPNVDTYSKMSHLPVPNCTSEPSSIMQQPQVPRSDPSSMPDPNADPYSKMSQIPGTTSEPLSNMQLPQVPRSDPSSMPVPNAAPYSKMSQLPVPTSEPSSIMQQPQVPRSDPSSMPVPNADPYSKMSQLPVPTSEPSSIMQQPQVPRSNPSSMTFKRPSPVPEPSLNIPQLPFPKSDPYSKMSQLPVPNSTSSSNVPQFSVSKSDPPLMMSQLPVTHSEPSSNMSQPTVPASDPYSKMSQRQVPDSEPSSIMPNCSVSESDPSLMMSQISGTHSEPFSNMPQFPVPKLDPYSKMSQLPVPLSEPSSNMPQSVVPKFDPYSKVSQLPEALSEPSITMPQPPIPISDPDSKTSQLQASFLKSSKMPRTSVSKSDTSSKMSELPLPHSEPSSNMPQLPIPKFEPYSGVSQLPVFPSRPSPNMTQLAISKYDPYSMVSQLPVPHSETSLSMPQPPVPKSDSYSKVSQLPVTLSDPTLNIPQPPVPEYDPWSKMAQLPVPNSEPSLYKPQFSVFQPDQLPVPLSNPFSNKPQIPVPYADPYSKTSQLPVPNSETSSNMQQPAVPKSDPYAKMSQLPEPNSDLSSNMPQLPIPISDISTMAQRPLPHSRPSLVVSHSKPISNMPHVSKSNHSLRMSKPHSETTSNIPQPLVPEYDPDSKMPQLPIPHSESSSDMPQFSVPNSDPYSTMSQLPVSSYETSSHVPQLPVPKSEPYSKVTQLPVPLPEPTSNMPQPPVPKSDPYSMRPQLPASLLEPTLNMPQLPFALSDPYSKMPKLPVPHSETSSNAPHLPVPISDTCSKVSQLPIHTSEPSKNMPPSPIPKLDPYSKISNLIVPQSKSSPNMPQMANIRPSISAERLDNTSASKLHVTQRVAISDIVSQNGDQHAECKTTDHPEESDQNPDIDDYSQVSRRIAAIIPQAGACQPDSSTECMECPLRNDISDYSQLGGNGDNEHSTEESHDNTIPMGEQQSGMSDYSKITENSPSADNGVKHPEFTHRERIFQPDQRALEIDQEEEHELQPSIDIPRLADRSDLLVGLKMPPISDYSRLGAPDDSNENNGLENSHEHSNDILFPQDNSDYSHVANNDEQFSDNHFLQDNQTSASSSVKASGLYMLDSERTEYIPLHDTISDYSHMASNSGTQDTVNHPMSPNNNANAPHRFHDQEASSLELSSTDNLSAQDDISDYSQMAESNNQSASSSPSSPKLGIPTSEHSHVQHIVPRDHVSSDNSSDYSEMSEGSDHSISHHTHHAPSNWMHELPTQHDINDYSQLAADDHRSDNNPSHFRCQTSTSDPSREQHMSSLHVEAGDHPLSYDNASDYSEMSEASDQSYGHHAQHVSSRQKPFTTSHSTPYVQILPSNVGLGNTKITPSQLVFKCQTPLAQDQLNSAEILSNTIQNCEVSACESGITSESQSYISDPLDNDEMKSTSLFQIKPETDAEKVDGRGHYIVADDNNNNFSGQVSYMVAPTCQSDDDNDDPYVTLEAVTPTS